MVEANSEFWNNGFIITWILNQIIMYSDKVKLVAGLKNDPLNQPPLPHSFFSDWMNELTKNDAHV